MSCFLTVILINTNQRIFSYFTLCFLLWYVIIVKRLFNYAYTLFCLVSNKQTNDIFAILHHTPLTLYLGLYLILHMISNSTLSNSMTNESILQLEQIIQRDWREEEAKMNDSHKKEYIQVVKEQRQRPCSQSWLIYT